MRRGTVLYKPLQPEMSLKYVIWFEDCVSTKEIWVCWDSQTGRKTRCQVRQADRQTDWQTDWPADCQTSRQSVTQRQMHKLKQTHRHTPKQTHHICLPLHLNRHSLYVSDAPPRRLPSPWAEGLVSLEKLWHLQSHHVFVMAQRKSGAKEERVMKVTQQL